MPVKVWCQMIEKAYTDMYQHLTNNPKIMSQLLQFVASMLGHRRGKQGKVKLTLSRSSRSAPELSPPRPRACDTPRHPF